MDLLPWQIEILQKTFKVEEDKISPSKKRLKGNNKKLEEIRERNESYKQYQLNLYKEHKNIQDVEKVEIPAPILVRALVGEPRWLAQIEGGAVDDLAGRTYTSHQLRRVIEFWSDIVYGYRQDLKPESSWDLETLQDQYKNLYEIDSKAVQIDFIWMVSSL
jgi:hypothetical protein